MLKFELFEAADGERSLARGLVDRIGGRGSVALSSEGDERTVRSIAAADHGQAARQTIRVPGSSGLLGGLEVGGHRVIHGGTRFSGPVRLDAAAEEAIEEIAELAPLHNGFSHQGPSLIDVMLSKRGIVARIYLQPDANTLLSCVLPAPGFSWTQESMRCRQRDQSVREEYSR